MKKDRSILSLAEHSARVLGSEPGGSAPAIAQLIRAGIAMTRGDRSRAVTILGDAASALERAAMHGYASAARFVLGNTIEDPAMVENAANRLRDVGVRDVPKFAALLVAGF